MKKVEKESFIKSFLLFFFSQVLLVSALFFLNYQKEKQTLDEQIFSQMRICSFSLQCKEFDIDFVPKKDQELYKLYKDKTEVSSYFTIPNSQKNYLKIYLPYERYQAQLMQIKKQLILTFIIVLLVISILSGIFSLYALRPLRDALLLTEEFIKDILHDFNTPLSTLRLNIAMLSKECGESTKLQRSQNAVQNILNLQSNLRSYLHAHASQKEHFLLRELANERIDLLGVNYPDINFSSDIANNITLHTNKDAFVRILDNLLSNAAKYNKQNGYVKLFYKEKKLIIKDSGKGIVNPKRIFERFYKEQERGIGIGLHIVKKLCDELGIVITVESEVEKGTKFTLDLSNIISH
ncbi:MAG: HAMP domain-containing sensor histidine kinase [Sulfurimonas sp.]